jgi:hypothetical protein
VLAGPVAVLLIRSITDTVTGLSGRDEDDQGDQEELGKDGREAHVEGWFSLLLVIVE